MAIKATGRATFTAVEDYDIVFVLNGIRCDVLNFDSVSAAENAVLEADFFNGGESCVVDKAVLCCYDGEGSVLGSPIEVHDAPSAIADGGSLYLSKDCKTITCDIYARDKKLCSKGMPVIRNGSSVGVESTKVEYAGSDSGTTAPTSGWQPTVPQLAQGKYLWTRTTVVYSDGNSTMSYSVGRIGMDGSKGGKGDAAVQYSVKQLNCTTASVKASGTGTDATFKLSAYLDFQVNKNVGGITTNPVITSIKATAGGETWSNSNVGSMEAVLTCSGKTSYTSSNRPPSSLQVEIVCEGKTLYATVPVSMESGVAIDINQNLASIKKTLQKQDGTINTISSTADANKATISTLDGRVSNVEHTVRGISSTVKDNTDRLSKVEQTAGNISLKVQSIERKSKNLLSGGNVTGLYNEQYEVFRSSAFVMEQGKNYTVTAKLWMESANNEHYIIVYVVGADDSWNYSYASSLYTSTTASVVRFRFQAGMTKQMVVRIFERDNSGKDPGSYNGVHVDWIRVDEGDWSGVDAKGDKDPNGRMLDKWEPSEEETDAVNLLPDPDFSETIGYSDAMGERNSYDKNMGDAVSWMSVDSSVVDGAHGVLFNRSGATEDTSAGLRYIMPFKGPGTYSLSCFVKDLNNTDKSKPTWESEKKFAIECNPMDANKTKITDGFAVSFYQNSQRFGDEQGFKSYTFGSTATRNNSEGTTTEVKIAYLEVRVYLTKNGSVRISRLCLSKSDHFIYWNANEVSEARKKDVGLISAGVDIDAHTVHVYGDNVKVDAEHKLEIKGDGIFNVDMSNFKLDYNGNLVSNSAMLKNAKISGTFSQPWVPTDNDTTSDNLVIADEVDDSDTFILPAGEGNAGRLLRLYHVGATDRYIYGFIEDRNGMHYYDFTDAKLTYHFYPYLVHRNSMVEFLAVGTVVSLIPLWKVINIYPAFKNLSGYAPGVNIPTLAYGRVDVSYESGSWKLSISACTFNGDKLYVSRKGVGDYVITSETSWISSDAVSMLLNGAGLYASVSAYGYEYDGTTQINTVAKASVLQISGGFSKNCLLEVITGDDDSPNDSSFFFEIKQMGIMDYCYERRDKRTYIEKKYSEIINSTKIH